MIVSEEKVKIGGVEDVARIMYSILEAAQPIDKEREHFWAIGLDSSNNTKFIEMANLGNVNMVYAAISNVFRLAVMHAHACTAVIFCHNHPSGKVTPSPEDRNFTKQLVEAGLIIGIRVLDHVIIGSNKNDFRYSFSSMGDIKDTAGYAKGLPHDYVPLMDRIASSQSMIDKYKKLDESNNKKLQNNRRLIRGLERQIIDLESKLEVIASQREGLSVAT